MQENKFSDDKLLLIMVTAFIAFTMIFLYLKILFY